MHTLFQINTTANWGSHGKIAEQIGNLVIQKGWDSYIAYGRWANPSSSKLVRVGSMNDERLHAALSRILDCQGLVSFSATKALIKRVASIRPSIVHLHNIHGYYLNYPLLFRFLQSLDCPVVWTLHDCWPFTGHCAYFDYAQCNRWKDICHAPCPCRRNYPSSIFVDGSKRNFIIKKQAFSSVRNLTLVPVSNWLKELIDQSFLKGYPVQVIHNGIDLDVFRPMDVDYTTKDHLGISKGRVIIGVANNWEERKGLQDFINLRSLLNDDYVILLVGVSQEQKESLPKGIIGINRTQNQEELAKLYSMADIFLNLTYEDNYPTTNLEAMACGTPVLTYKTGGSPEAVSKETGWIVEQGNIQRVAEIIMSDLSSVNREDCRKRAEVCFDNERCFEAYFNLYEKLLCVK